MVDRQKSYYLNPFLTLCPIYWHWPLNFPWSPILWKTKYKNNRSFPTCCWSHQKPDCCSPKGADFRIKSSAPSPGTRTIKRKLQLLRASGLFTSSHFFLIPIACWVLEKEYLGRKGQNWGKDKWEFPRQGLVHPIPFLQEKESLLFSAWISHSRSALHYSQVITTLPLHKQQTYFFGQASRFLMHAHTCPQG